VGVKLPKRHLFGAIKRNSKKIIVESNAEGRKSNKTIEVYKPVAVGKTSRFSSAIPGFCVAQCECITPGIRR
jgi:hypothetical protein